MAYKHRTEDEIAGSQNSSPSLSETLLFATLCIVGLPVDVHVKDGSVYSGIFYTASVDGDYGIVLKKATLTKKGKSNTNVTTGSEIETLVILSADLVQVVAKGVVLPSDCVTGNIEDENVESHSGTVPRSEVRGGEVKVSVSSGLDTRPWNHRSRSSIQKENTVLEVTSEKVMRKQEARNTLPNDLGNTVKFELGKRDGGDVTKNTDGSDNLIGGRRTGESCSPREGSDDKQKPVYQEENGDAWSSSSTYSNFSQVDPIGEESDHMKSVPLNTGACCDPSGLVKPDNKLHKIPASVCSSSSSPVASVDPESCQRSLKNSSDSVPSKISSNKTSKEFKLNPGAKIFSPSFAKPTSAAPVVPTIANMAYIPSNSPMAGVGGAAQLDVGINSFAPLPSIPSKFGPYGNFPTGNNGSGSQLSQPVVGHLGNRTQPIRYAAQYHPIQSAPMLMNSNPQVMVGRLGQLVYVQPVSQDLVPGAATISPFTPRPMQQAQMPKHQGTATALALQVCMPQAFAATGQPPYAVPAHVPVLQPPFSANRPMPVPCPNGFFTPKFP